MTTTPQDSIYKLRELGYPTIFEQIALGTSEIIRRYCGPPKRFYQLAGTEGVSTDWLPLWEFDGDELYAYDIGSAEYFRFEYSSGEKSVIARGYQRFVTILFLEFADAGLMERVNLLAPQFDYKYIRELQAYVEVEAPDDDEFLNTIVD